MIDSSGCHITHLLLCLSPCESSHPRWRLWKLRWPSVCSPLGLMAVLATYELMGNWPRWCFLLNATWIFCGRLHGWSLPLPLTLVIEQHFCDTGCEPWWGSYMFPQSVIGENDSEEEFLPRGIMDLFYVSYCHHLPLIKISWPCSYLKALLHREHFYAHMH